MKRKTKKENSSTPKNMREHSFQEIGDEIGLSRMRICQLEKLILEKIKKSGDLKEYA